MKRTSLLLVLILLIGSRAFGMEIPGYEGGIANENTYKEVVFITGEPIELVGTLKVNIKEKKDIRTEQYTYKLENLEKNAKLSRTIKLSIDLKEEGKQVSSSARLDSYKESLSLGKEKYEVKTEDYQWNQGTISENPGLVDFYAGDWSARKTYRVNRGEKEVTVDTIGSMVGYKSPWSGTQTQRLEHIIDHKDRTGAGLNWQGTALVEGSYNRTKDYNYVENTPSQISFAGGYILTDKEENILKYSYDLPSFTGQGLGAWRNIGSSGMTLDTNPIITRLNIPRTRDVLGLPGEMDLLLMASMKAFPYEGENLGPRTMMSRGDFARLIVESMDIPLVEEEKTRRKKKDPVLESFKDTPASHRNFGYIEAVNRESIMEGTGKDIFQGDRTLTREEGVTILIRALGLNKRAPIMTYTTGFKDDKDISPWAKDHVYMARLIGLVDGDYFNPKEGLNKEEAAVLMVNYINYLQEDLREDFSQGLLNH